MPKRIQLTTQERRIRVYRARNRNLRAMGFKDYKEYLESDLWKGIRKRVLTINPNCVGCGERAWQVHHSVYRKKDLEGQDLRALFSVCGNCHKYTEFNRSGEKMHPKQATTKLKQLATLIKKGSHA